MFVENIGDLDIVNDGRPDDYWYIEMKKNVPKSFKIEYEKPDGLTWLQYYVSWKSGIVFPIEMTDYDVPLELIVGEVSSDDMMPGENVTYGEKFGSFNSKSVEEFYFKKNLELTDRVWDAIENVILDIPTNPMASLSGSDTIEPLTISEFMDTDLLDIHIAEISEIYLPITTTVRLYRDINSTTPIAISLPAISIFIGDPKSDYPPGYSRVAVVESINPNSTSELSGITLGMILNVLSTYNLNGFKNPILAYLGEYIIDGSQGFLLTDKND